eukprot:7607191-Pyramimonas_sp.AAC.1
MLRARTELEKQNVQLMQEREKMAKENKYVDHSAEEASRLRARQQCTFSWLNALTLAALTGVSQGPADGGRDSAGPAVRNEAREGSRAGVACARQGARRVQAGLPHRPVEPVEGVHREDARRTQQGGGAAASHHARVQQAAGANSKICYFTGIKWKIISTYAPKLMLTHSPA